MKKLEKQFWKRYKLLCLVRIILVFIPQTGYIHPDEYFQSIEILSGDTFELDSNRPWEFNVTFPIRSISIPYFTVGLSYRILKTADMFIYSWLETTMISPYMLLVIPRLFVCLMSFLCDYCMYYTCVANNEKYKSRLLILSSSYVMLIYGSRTFSNTLEMIFFSILLYYISESMIFSNVIVKHHEYFKKRYDNSETAVDRAKFHKMTLFLAPHSYRSFFVVSTITVLGFFNRPTFLCYAFIPVFFWLYRSIGSKSVTSLQFHLRSTVILLSAVPVILFLVIIDSFYYGYLTWGEVGMLDISIKNFVVPCFNFIRYNWNEKNLETHGKHPMYLHLFVNIPLLFNVLGIFGLFGIGDLLKKLLRRKYHLLPTVKSIKGLMVAAMLTPLFLLSAFAHQEPRFIIPIIFPMVYLYAHKIYEEPDFSVAESKNDAIKVKKTNKKSPLLFKLWLMANIALTIFYGFIHQGGIYPAYDYLSKEANLHPNTQYNIFTSHIYSLPYTMFLQPDPNKLFYSKTSKYTKSKRIFLYEEGSKDVHGVLQKINAILQVLEAKKIRNKMLYILPSSLDRNIEEIRPNHTQISVKKMKTLYPHLSTEAFPDVTDFIHKIAFVDIKSLDLKELLWSLCNVFKSFGLSIYTISLAN
ncbi:hypothetical protein AMK59_8381 [Oryctes borbonicus]|uniref:Mannosyltransferase n=1 Tax=Oryctes borbonicus TaxID=1629725 RepID=A0A0T6AUX7_9SCAR|nr:hypothetical protein AMK59_8381 [Oryctes borbonicus]